MSDNFLDKTTEAVGWIYTLVVIGVLASIMIWG